MKNNYNFIIYKLFFVLEIARMSLHVVSYFLAYTFPILAF